MNIFILDEDLDTNAEYHVDKHIVKMPLEAAQMLCTVHWINKYVGYVPRKLTSDEWALVSKQKTNIPRDFPYLPTMYNHPCTIWARSSMDNYEWLYTYALALGEEYTYRYGKVHKSIRDCVLNLPSLQLPSNGLTEFAQAMPDECKRPHAIDAYREFYHKDKASFASWKFREKQAWWDEERADYESRISR